MAKLYIFGIGGTGSRVLRALSMLLASGVRLNDDISEVIPIIIDPDVANGDMSRTLEILKLYQDIRSSIERTGSFFSTHIQTLPQHTNSNNPSSSGNFQFQIDGTSNLLFKEYIGKANMSTENDSFSELLFSRNNLNAKMDIGFKGNPNIGSTVLNQMATCRQYIEFAQSFTKGDKIFIISSIFGGTGASGFPLLLKNLRSENPSIPKSSEIRDAIIGGISVLPYFNVASDDNSQIDSDTFYDKAKAALMYYDRTIIGSKQVNALYYIGDRPKITYQNHEGNQEQKNEAHFVELAAAYSIVDFCKSKNNYITSEGVAHELLFKEFGIDGGHNPVTFRSLDKEMHDDIAIPLSRFKFLKNYLDYGLEKAIGVTNWSKTTKMDVTFFKNDFSFNSFKKFTLEYDIWLNELAHNEDSFAPFNLSTNTRNPYDFINDKDPRMGLFGDSGFKSIEKRNLSCFNDFSMYNPFTQFLRMTEDSINKELVDKKLI